MPIGDSPVEGKADAKVTMVEITDFQCPFCGRAAPTVKELQKKYGDDLRLVVKMNPLPFHPNAMPAAKAALAAQKQGKFFEMYDLLFANQTQLSPENEDKWAQQIGLDMNKFHADLNDKGIEDRIKTEQALGQKVGLAGTPGFVINGKKISGAQPAAEFEKTIDAEIAHANQMIASGVKQDQIYDTIQKTAKAAAAAAPQQNPNQPQAAQVRKVDLPADEKEYSRGAKDPKVTIVEFSDFQCPFCGRVEPTLASVLQKYPTAVRVVWRNEPLPFHPNAMPAAEAACAAAEQGKFWEMHDEMYKNQTQLSPENYKKWAADNHLNMDKWQKSVDSHECKAKIEADAKYGNSVGANGTPAFFINGRNLVGAQPVDAFNKIIDEEIKHADAFIKKGLKGDKLYEALVDDNVKNAPKAPAPGAGAGAPADNGAPVDVGSIANAPVRGAPNAPVSIVMWSDFQCPFCGRAEPTVKQIEDEYGSKVKVVWKNQPLPFHPNAMPAAKAAYAAGKQGKFWEMHDLLFSNQQGLSPDTYDKYAQQLGLDMNKFHAVINDPATEAAIKADSEQGQKLGANGTPTFFIDGRKLVGAQPAEQFKSIIDDELKKKGGKVADAKGPVKKG